jgi:hypothetical protein
LREELAVPQPHSGDGLSAPTSFGILNDDDDPEPSGKEGLQDVPIRVFPKRDQFVPELVSFSDRRAISFFGQAAGLRRVAAGLRLVVPSSAEA